MLSTKPEVHNVSQRRTPEENWGNMHEKFGKDRVCGFGDILADRQTNTHRRANHNTSQSLSRAK